MCLLTNAKSLAQPRPLTLVVIIFSSWASYFLPPIFFRHHHRAQLWDTRRPSKDGPGVSMHSEQPQSVVNDIAVHPDHNYAVAATDGDGSVVVWDVRHAT